MYAGEWLAPIPHPFRCPRRPRATPSVREIGDRLLSAATTGARPLCTRLIWRGTDRRPRPAWCGRRTPLAALPSSTVVRRSRRRHLRSAPSLRAGRGGCPTARRARARWTQPTEPAPLELALPCLRPCPVTMATLRRRRRRRPASLEQARAAILVDPASSLHHHHTTPFGRSDARQIYTTAALYAVPWRRCGA